MMPTVFIIAMLKKEMKNSVKTCFLRTPSRMISGPIFDSWYLAVGLVRGCGAVGLHCGHVDPP